MLFSLMNKLLHKVFDTLSVKFDCILVLLFQLLMFEKYSNKHHCVVSAIIIHLFSLSLYILITSISI